MIAFVFAAALLADATPMQKVAYAPPPPAVERVREGASGQVPYSVAVTVECTAHVDGRVGGCAVLGETDPDMGFGEAAIALMQDARVAPGDQDTRFARTIQFVP